MLLSKRAHLSRQRTEPGLGFNVAVARLGLQAVARIESFRL